jgi:hypothetical protein
VRLIALGRRIVHAFESSHFSKVSRVRYEASPDLSAPLLELSLPVIPAFVVLLRADSYRLG